MYKIRLNDDGNEFHLYQNNLFVGAHYWIGQHLLNIAECHGVDLSQCFSESHMLSILKIYVDVEVVDE